jgi:hypothetical protein
LCAEGDDYEAIDLEVTLTGNPSSNEDCISVTLLSDDIVEPVEEFTLRLASNDTALSFTQSSSQVVVQDNTGDCKTLFAANDCHHLADVVLGFSVAAVEVEEGGEAQTVCVILFNAVTLEIPVQVMIITEESNQGNYDIACMHA